ncbi:MAG: Dam family site-specific DNA-(adenine-N6)-methyltransferase [Labilithrix sp.]|nr:Dam family site-specific DNA-(adenine-N6)-methyltransferase [Labilithrix sp.]
MKARPVVKWAGGKSRLLDRLRPYLPEGSFGTYAEPFAGGAAMFFDLASEPERRFERAVLADMNRDLVGLYCAIKSDVHALIDKLGKLQKRHLSLTIEKRSEHFYAVRKRSTNGMSDVDRGVRLLFLNKTCFNGLWRVNASGQFNVPFGRYANPKILDEEVLLEAHEALSCATIHHGDYREVTRDLKRGDFAYFDPPYEPVSKTSNFTAYAGRFGPDEQRQLAQELARLHDGGVRAMLSNAEAPSMRQLYGSHGFIIGTVAALRPINSDPKKRGEVTELVVTTYELQKARRASSRAAV